MILDQHERISRFPLESGRQMRCRKCAFIDLIGFGEIDQVATRVGNEIMEVVWNECTNDAGIQQATQDQYNSRI